jgi:hypothetical protein
VIAMHRITHFSKRQLAAGLAEAGMVVSQGVV